MNRDVSLCSERIGLWRNAMEQRLIVNCDACGAECRGLGKLRLSLWFGLNQGTSWDYCGATCMLKSIGEWVAKRHQSPEADPDV